MPHPTPHLGLLVIDMQKRYVDYLHYTTRRDPAEVADQVKNIVAVVGEAVLLRLPIVFTELRGYGRTVTEVLSPALNPPYLRLLPSMLRPTVRIMRKRFSNAFEDSNLEEMLRRKGVRELVVMGVNASGCVKHTVEGAVERSFGVVTSLDLLSDEVGMTSLNKSAEFYMTNTGLKPSCTDVISYMKSCAATLALAKAI